ncbi:MAG: nitroreductase family deazaflavin-dependent oxidoreductase [Chloroflexota bacterium]
MEDDLVSWGRVLRIETRGRVTGRPASAAVGFVERPDGTLVVAAGSPGSDWARNLLADPACGVTIGDASWAAVARPLEGAEHAAAVRDLILRYGTPAEGLGAGPAFELRRAGVSGGGPGGPGVSGGG